VRHIANITRYRRISRLAFLLGLMLSSRLAAQNGDWSPSSEESSPSSVEFPPTVPSLETQSQPVPKVEREFSWKKLIPNLVSDQKKIWKFPFTVASGQHAGATAGVLAAAAGLIALDRHDEPYFRRTTSFHGYNQVFSNRNTAIGMTVLPTALYFSGLARNDSKMQKTAGFALEAFLDAEFIATVMKDVDRRESPASIPPGGDFAHTWFKRSGPALRGIGVFPSGHTIAAFSLATITARQYSNHKWVPYACYGLATMVGFSRVTLSGHFVSDVVVGGLLGYSISRFAVLRK
jgi:hypothetical protein